MASPSLEPRRKTWEEADALQSLRGLRTVPGLMPRAPLRVVPGIFPEHHNSGEPFPTTRKAHPGSEGWCRAQGSPPLQSRHRSCPCLPRLLLCRGRGDGGMHVARWRGGPDLALTHGQGWSGCLPPPARALLLLQLPADARLLLLLPRLPRTTNRSHFSLSLPGHDMFVCRA